MSRRLVAVLFSILIAIGLCGPALAELSGDYRGIDAADGMKLTLSSSGGRISGRLTESSGAVATFTANPLPSGAEARTVRNGRDVYFIFNEEPLGVSLVVLPLGPNDTASPAETEAMFFLRAGVAQPPRPSRYVPPPEGPGGTIDPRAFVESYAFWPSANVAYGYAMVRGRYRTLIRLHPVVQADILWKLCRADTSPAVLEEALRGQSTTCGDVLAAFGRMLKPGGSVEPFNRFRKDVEAQKAALVEAIVCSIDYRRNDPECKRAGARVAKAAVSLVTVKSVLERY
ncbi:hypothetical protein [Pikeienuella sp. HZG-20]|uniref:hypothetical protein n=1 Tax=Paludibacillus litoralis TaxID=3133267 RepID=UPI0030EE022E